MHFDALTLACVTRELQRTICPGRVQQILLVDDHSVGLEIYAHHVRRQLLLSAAPEAPRVHLVTHKLRRGVERETPLLLLLRKYVRDAVLVAVEQPDPVERVLKLHFEHKEHGATVLVAELLGRQGNLLLLASAGRILDCLTRSTEAGGGSRTLLPRHTYVPPQPQTRRHAAGADNDENSAASSRPSPLAPRPSSIKLSPLDDGSADYATRLAAVIAQPGRLWKVLVDGVAGISPTAAREVAWRAAGHADAPSETASVAAVAEALQSLWAAVRTDEWTPGWFREGADVVGFAAYTVHFRGSFEPAASISDVLERWYAHGGQQPGPRNEGAPPHPDGIIGASGEWRVATVDSAVFDVIGAAGMRSEPVQVDAYAAQRGQMRSLLKRARQQGQRRLAALAGDEPAPGEPERTRVAAEWLLALHSQIVPGQETLDVDLDGETLQIRLDARVTPVEQAQQLFKRAAKLERAAAFVPQRREKLLQDMEFLRQLDLDLERATNQPEIAAVGEELRAAGLSSDKRTARPAQRVSQDTGGPLRFRSRQGMEILVGRNARQNELVTFKLSHPDDLWLHVRNAPGAHVVVRTAGQSPAPDTVQAAAQLAAYHSAARGERAAAVTVTRRRWVSRAPGGRTGQVVIRQEEEVQIVAGEMPDSAVRCGCFETRSFRRLEIPVSDRAKIRSLR